MQKEKKNIDWDRHRNNILSLFGHLFNFKYRIRRWSHAQLSDFEPFFMAITSNLVNYRNSRRKSWRSLECGSLDVTRNHSHAVSYTGNQWISIVASAKEYGNLAEDTLIILCTSFNHVWESIINVAVWRQFDHKRTKYHHTKTINRIFEIK